MRESYPRNSNGVLMSFSAVFNTVTLAEPIICGLALFAFTRARDHKRFSAMGFYLALRTVSALALSVLAFGSLPLDRHARYAVYFYTYWLSYVVGAVLIFFVIQQLFRYLMAPLPGLSRLGTLAFRWATAISIIITMAIAVFPAVGAHLGSMLLPAIALELMRCMSILELCLLAFLALSVHALGLSFRSRVFGIGLGFGTMAAMEFVISALGLNHPTYASTLNLAGQFVTLTVLITWSAYCLMPDPARRPVMLPVTSPLLRWNEIATALGHSNAQVVVGPSSSDYFLANVESVVDKALAKNALNPANQSR